MRRPPDDTNAMKPLRFIDAAHDGLMDVPEKVRREFGHGLYRIQQGRTPENATPFESSTGTNIMKLTERHDTDTYRCVYTAKFEKAIFVLHVFMKKSASGIATPQREIEAVQERFRRAQQLYAEEFETEEPTTGGRNKRGKR